MDGLEPATTVEGTLHGNDISVESVSLDDAVSLTYLAAFPNIEPDHGKVGYTVTSFLEHAHDDEFESGTVRATMLRSEDDVQATWTLETDWIRAYNNYTFDDEELSQHILDSLYEEDDA